MNCFNLKDFGAIGDGKYLNTDAFSRALQACAEAGGGRVIVPEGTYLTGPIRLYSDIELHVEAGATVLFSRDFEHYPLVKTHFEGEETVRCVAPLGGEGLHNVSITGKGVFDGQGEAWRHVKKSKLTPQEWAELRASGGVADETLGIWWPTVGSREGEHLVKKLRASGQPVRIEDYLPARDFLRPNMVKLVECQNIVLDGPTFRNSPCWNVHLLFCENVTIRNVTVLCPWYAQNGDGFDIESCRNVEITHCFLDVGDDAICLKSGKDEEGRRRNRPCENVTVRHCTVLHGHGGLTIGSEMSGGVRNVTVSDCVFRGTDIGLRFKTARGRGGVVEKIDIANITMSEIKGAAISFDMYYGGHAWGEGERDKHAPQPLSDATPQFRDIAMRDISCDGAALALEMRGLPEMPIQNISLENARMKAEWGIVLEEAKEITLRNIQVQSQNVSTLQCDNVRGLTLENVDVRYEPTPHAPAESEAPQSYAFLPDALNQAAPLNGSSIVNGNAMANGNGSLSH